MEYYYAQLDENSICFVVTQNSGDMSQYPNLIRIQSFDDSLLGKKWNGTDWEEVPVT